MRKKVIIRPYRKEDEEAVRDICWATGFNGEPADKWVDMNREFFTDMWLGYYLRMTPELILVAEADGHVVGYVTACSDTGTKDRWLKRVYHREVVHGLLTRRYRFGRRTIAMLGHMLYDTLRYGGLPELPDKANSAHLHYNVRPEFRESGYRCGVKLLFAAFAMLIDKGARQLVTWIVLRPDELSHRYRSFGRVHDFRRTTLYAGATPDPLYIISLVVDLNDSSNRYRTHYERLKKVDEAACPTAPKAEM
jgi:hypothetical protein